MVFCGILAQHPTDTVSKLMTATNRVHDDLIYVLPFLDPMADVIAPPTTSASAKLKNRSRSIKPTGTNRPAAVTEMLNTTTHFQCFTHHSRLFRGHPYTVFDSVDSPGPGTSSVCVCSISASSLCWSESCLGKPTLPSRLTWFQLFVVVHYDTGIDYFWF